MTELIIKVDDDFLQSAKLKGMESQYELVRCKDCRWGQAHAHDGLRICEYHDDFPKMDDDFCSRGEKVWII